MNEWTICSVKLGVVRKWMWLSWVIEGVESEQMSKKKKLTQWLKKTKHSLAKEVKDGHEKNNRPIASETSKTA